MHPTSFPLLQIQSLAPKLSQTPHHRHKINHKPRPPSVASFPPRAPLGLRYHRARCAASSSDNGAGPSPPEDVVSSMVDELLTKDENKDLLDGLESATRRVDRANEALAGIERRQAEARRAAEYALQLKKKESEIAESQKELLEARAMVEEATRSLSLNLDEINGDAGNEDINKDAERLESIKAALFSSISGSLAGLPISLYQSTSYSQLALHLITIFISCALFGITFRYAVRRDIDNVQLKTGTSAAFGFVRGLATLVAGDPLEPNVDSLISHSFDGTVYVAQNFFIFLSAAIALDFCFKVKILSPFPKRK